MKNYLRNHFSALPGGAFIGLAGNLSVIASMGFENPSAASLCAAVVFCSGLLLVFLTGSKLFTGQVTRFQTCQSAKDRLEVSLSLVGTYIGNAIGSALLALAFYYALPKIAGTIAPAMAETAAIKCTQTPFGLFLSGTICNACVAGAVALRQRGNGYIVSLVPVAAFVMLGAEHIVAIFTYLTYGFLLGTITFMDALPLFIFVTLGNIFGGLIIAWVCKYSRKRKVLQA